MLQTLIDKNLKIPTSITTLLAKPGQLKQVKTLHHCQFFCVLSFLIPFAFFVHLNASALVARGTFQLPHFGNWAIATPLNSPFFTMFQAAYLNVIQVQITKKERAFQDKVLKKYNHILTHLMHQIFSLVECFKEIFF